MLHHNYHDLQIVMKHLVNQFFVDNFHAIYLKLKSFLKNEIK